MSAQSRFVISLDFELAWGVELARAVDGNRASILGAREAIPRILDLFAQRGIRCTWATVGMLFFEGREELLKQLPAIKPAYRRTELSAYERIPNVGKSEASDPMHYGLSLIQRIKDCPGQEVACHTFSHYYSLEEGQDAPSFRSDLEAAVAAARGIGVDLRSLVFPRNQVQASYLPICAELGIRAYRGNADFWLYRGRDRSRENLFLRAARLADSYLPISGPRSVGNPDASGLPVNVPASMFLRPASEQLDSLERMRLARLTRAMTHAAITGTIFHLWWHPENFGTRTDSNIRFLSHVLDHFGYLRDQHGMRSCMMDEVAVEALASRVPDKLVA